MKFTILVLGVSGMLGNTLYRFLKTHTAHTIFGTCRNRPACFASDLEIRSNIDILEESHLIALLAEIKPHIIINCIGVIKQLERAKDPCTILPINTLFPHKLANICSLAHIRLIHISTDCVFSGLKGGYAEQDEPDAPDLYGQSKLWGEIKTESHVLTLRTSIIGHGLQQNLSLLDWFLSREGQVKGYTKAIFSGLPTVELAKLISLYIIPNPQIWGLYHVASEAIDKYTLLQMIADIYRKKIQIVQDDSVIINRSLKASAFEQQTGYKAPPWPDLIAAMHAFG